MTTLMTGCKLQRHRRCGYCGKRVNPWKSSRKCDGWHWHRRCWCLFLTGKEPANAK